MVSLDEVRTSNSKIKDLGSGLVAVFVGGTSGIGETTARELVRNAVAPTIYLIGRSESAATRLTDEFGKLNADAKVNFIQADTALLRNVDKACDEIKQKESKVNLLVMSSGYLTTSGARDETAEGLDKKMSLHYYSRMRFTVNLLPLLSKAAESSQLSRVVSVLSAGEEGYPNVDDLALKRNHSLRNNAVHCITMNSLAVEHLAKANPDTSFVHIYPGGVKTNIMRENGPIMRAVMNSVYWVAYPWTVEIKECGERHVFAGTSEKYPSKAKGGEGSGSYLLGWKGTWRGNEKVMKELRSKQMGDTVWQHTEEVFDSICKEGGPGKY